MKRRFGSGFALIAISMVVLSGCGLTDKDQSKPNPTGTAEVSTTDVDITSGCWKAANRGAGEGELESPHQQWKVQPQLVINQEKTFKATIETSAGFIVVELFPKEAPVTVNNFVCLAQSGYFDGTPVHRIVKDFVVQGGDPTGTGMGGPGYRFADEPVVRNYVKGTVAMANSGPDTNGSQFFICSADLTNGLKKDYTIFGQVVEGMVVVDQLNSTPTRALESGAPATSPIVLVSISKVEIAKS